LERPFSAQFLIRCRGWST